MPRHVSLRFITALAFLALVALPGTAGAQAADGNALCSCVARWYDAKSQVDRLADVNLVQAGWEERASTPWAFSPSSGVCVATLEIWRPVTGERGLAHAAIATLAEAARICAEEPGASRQEVRTDAWRDLPAFDAVRSQIVGHDACAVTGGPVWQMFDNAGRQRSLPGFLSDRIQRQYAVLDKRDWLQSAVAALRGAPSVDEALARMTTGAPGGEKQFVWFGDTFVRHYLSHTSLATIVGREEGPSIAPASSEHGSIRGTCNGGGDFIRFMPGSSSPRLVRAAWTPSLQVDADVRLDAIRRWTQLSVSRAERCTLAALLQP